MNIQVIGPSVDSPETVEVYEFEWIDNEFGWAFLSFRLTVWLRNVV